MDTESFGIGIILKWTKSDVDKQILAIQNYIDTKKINAKINIDTKDIETVATKVNAISKQLSNVSKSSTTNIQFLNDKEISDKVQRINNALERLKVNKDKVFADPRVNSDVLKLNSMIEQFKKSEVSAKDLSLQMDNLSTTSKKVSGEFKNVNHDGYAFSQMLDLSIKKILIWQLGATAIFGGLRAIQNSIQVIRDMETQMTSIARVMDDVNFQMETYRDNLLDIAKQTGSTFKDSADVSLRFAQAGYNVADSLQLTKTAMAAVQTAELDATNATESMIGIMSQWNMQASEMPLLLDKINKISDEYTLTSQDLVDGLLRSSSASKNLGLSIDETISLLTVLRESSGRTGREVGNALNSILSYATRGKTVDILEKAGIQVFSDASKTQFRNYMDVFKDISAQWNGLSSEVQNGFIQSADEAGLFNEELSQTLGLEKEWSDVQKRDVSNATAGTYRRNYFLGLMNSMSKTKDVLKDLQGSEGYTFVELQKRTETLDSRINILNSSLKELVSVISDDGGLFSLKGLVSIADGLVNAITMIAEKVGGLNLVIASAVGIVGLFSKGFRDLGGVISGSIPGLNSSIEYFNKIKTAKSELINNQNNYITKLREEIATGQLGNIAREKNITSMKGLNTELNTAKLSLVGYTASSMGATVATFALQTAMTMGLSIAITAVISGIAKLTDSLITTKKEQQETFATLIGSIQTLKQETSEIPALISQYEELSKITQKTAQEKEKFASVTERLSGLFEGSVTGFTAEGKAAGVDIAYIKQLTAEKEKYLETQKKELASRFKASGNDDLKNLQQQQIELQKLQSQIAEYNSKIEDINSGKVSRYASPLDSTPGRDYLQYYKQQIVDIQEQQATLQNEMQTTSSQFVEGAYAVDQTSESISKLSKSMQNDLKNSVINTKGTMDDFYSATEVLEDNNVSKSIQDIVDHMNTMSTDGKSTSDDIKSYLNKSIDDLITKYKNLGVEVPLITSFLESFRKSLNIPEISEVSDQINKVAYSTEDLTKDLSNLESTTKDVAEAMAEYDSQGKLSADTIANLVNKHPELLEQLTLTKNGLELNKTALINLKDTELSTLTSRLEAEKNFTSVQKTEINKRINDLAKEAEAFKNLKDIQSGETTLTSQERANRISNNQVQQNDLQQKINADNSIDAKIAAIKALASQSYKEDYSSATTKNNKTPEEPVTGPYAQLIRESAKQNSLSATLLDSLVKQESGFREKVVSSAGAIGLTQLMPSTAKELGVMNPYNATENLAGGAKYLREMLDKFGNDIQLALAAYNSGQGTVSNALRKTNGSSFADIKNLLPRETQNYVASIMSDYNARKLDTQTIEDITKQKAIETQSYKDTTEAILNEANAQAELTKAKQEALQKEIDQAKSNKDYQTYLEKSNELIALQSDELDKLNKKQDQINQLKDSTLSSSKSQFGDINRWFTGQSNQESVAYVNEYNSASDETRKVMESLFTTMQKLRNEWISNSKAISDNKDAQQALSKQIQEDTISAIQEQSQSLSSSEVSKIETSFSNLNITQWIEDNISATSDWSDVIERLQEEIAKIGNPSTLQGQKKYNELLQESADKARETLKAQIQLQEQMDKSAQEALFAQTDQDLADIMDQINAIDQQQKLGEGGFSSSVPEIDMDVVPHIDLTSIDDAVQKVKDQAEEEFQFTLPTTFVDYINNTFTNTLTIAQDNINTLKQKIADLGQITPQNQGQLEAYLQQWQKELDNLSNTASEAKKNLQDSFKAGQISQDEYNQQLQALNNADISILATPKLQLTSEYQFELENLKKQYENIPITVDSQAAEAKIAELIADAQKKLSINLDNIVDVQSTIANLTKDSIKTIHIQTVYDDSSSGSSGNEFAEGTLSAPEGVSKVGEKGKELILEPNGKTYLSGDKAELRYLPKGTAVIPNKQTEELLDTLGVPAYADGNVDIHSIEAMTTDITDLRETISDVTDIIESATKILTKNQKALDKSNKDIEQTQKNISKYATVNDDGTVTIKDEYVGNKQIERKVASANKTIQTALGKNEGYTANITSANATITAQTGIKTSAESQIATLTKIIANLKESQAIETKIGLYNQAINVAQENIEKITASIEKYRNADGTYEDNQTVRDAQSKIQSYLEAEESAQQSIKQLVQERFEAEYEGYDKVQKDDESQIAILQKTLQYQQSIGASVKEQLETEQQLLDIRNDELQSLQTEKTQLEAEKNALIEQAKAALSQVNQNYTEEDLLAYLSGLQEYTQITDKLTDVNSQIIDTNISIQQTADEIDKIKFDNILKPFKDVVSNLQAILGLLDEKDFAGHISNIASQISATQGEIAAINQKIAEVQNNASLTAGEKASKISDLTSQLTDAESALKSLIDTEKDWENKQLADTFSTQYETIEKTLFNGQTQEEAQDALNQRIALQKKYIDGQEKDLELSKIKNQVLSEGLTLTADQQAILDSTGQIERSSIERLQKQLDIQEAQVKLQNLQNQKTIQQLTQDANGNWDFTYVADQDALIQAQDDLANKQVDLINWEQDLLNQADQDAIDEKSKYLSRLKQILDNAQNGEYASTQEFNNAMTALNQKYMSGIVTTTDINWRDVLSTTQTNLDGMTSAYSTYVSNLQALAEQAKQALQDILNAQQANSQAQAQSAQQTRAGETYGQQAAEMSGNNANGSIPTVNVNKVWNIGYPTAHDTMPNVVVTDSNGKIVDVTVTRTNDSNFSVTPKVPYENGKMYTLSADGIIQKFLASTTGSYKDGGVIDYTGTAQVHGSKSSSEVAFNASQAKKLYELVKDLPETSFDFKSILKSVSSLTSISSMFKVPDIGKTISSIVKNTSQAVNQTFNVTANFPNVTTRDEIKQALIGLPEYATQQIHIVGVKG